MCCVVCRWRVRSRETKLKVEKKMSEEERKQHVVLVHGACHGAWCWYKVKPQLEASGHRVTAVDLAASGIDMTRSITDISTCEQYSEPLMQLMTSLPDDEKVVLVGHSLGGLSLAMAMDMFPTKISVSVFVTAMMPDTKHSPSFVWDKVFWSYLKSMSIPYIYTYMNI